MRLASRWWRFALAPLAVSMAFSVSIPGYVFADTKPSVTRPSAADHKQYYDQGIHHYTNGDFQAAVDALTQAIHAQPENPDYYSARGNAYVRMGALQMAQSDYMKARELSQKPKKAFTGKSTSFYQDTAAQQQPAQTDQSAQTPAPAGEEPAQLPESLPTPGAAAAEIPSLASTPQALDTASTSTDSGVTLAGALAARVASAPQNVGAPATSVTAQDASVLIPQSTGELLQAASSVNARRTSTINLDPRVRGFNDAQVVATANGMNQLKARQDIDSQFSYIDPGIVDNIQVINGPYTSLYGLGYAFLIADLFPTQRSCAPEFHGSTIFTQDSNGRDLYFRQNVYGSGADWGFYASSGLRTGNDYQPGGDSIDFRVPASYRKWDGYLALSLDMTERSRFEVNYLRTELNNAELPGVVYDINYAENEQFNVRYVIQDDPEGPEQFVLQYWYNRSPFHGDSTRQAKQTTFLGPFVRSNFFGNATDNAVLGFPFFDESFDVANVFINGALQSTGVRALTTWGEADSVQLTAGVDYRRVRQQYSEVDLDFNGDNAFGGVFGIPLSSQEDYGVFTNLAVPVTEDIVLTVGGRLDSTRAYVDTTDLAFIGVTGDGRPNEILGMAYGTLKIQLTDALSMNIGSAYGQRNPTLTELYGGQPFVPLVRYGNSFVVGNSELTPERNLQFDLGLTGEWENFTFAARSYYSNIDNYILYSITGIGDASFFGAGEFTSLEYTYRNLERASLYGGDAFAEAKLLRWLALNGTLSYTRGTNHSPVGSGSEGLPNIYPLAARVGVRVFEPCNERWGVSFITRMVHGQDFVADSLAEVPTDGFTVFDVRAYYRVSDNLRLTSAVENLFDRVYTQHGSLAIVDSAGNLSFVKEPGINFLMGAELSY